MFSKWRILPVEKNISCYFNRGIDTVKITALSNHKPGILNNYIRMFVYKALDFYEVSFILVQ
jgi:hypothetical protein